MTRLLAGDNDCELATRLCAGNKNGGLSGSGILRNSANGVSVVASIPTKASYLHIFRQMIGMEGGPGMLEEVGQSPMND